jgi:hypothetical protein
MSAKIVNLLDPDEGGTLYATVEEADTALAEMIDKFKTQGYRISRQHLSGEDYPQYAVYDHGDDWIGTYTIVL